MVLLMLFMFVMSSCFKVKQKHRAGF